MDKYVDALGKSCPIPLVMAKEAIRGMDGGCLTVAVDNEIAVQNLTKMANHKGYGVSFGQTGERRYEVTMILGGNPADSKEDKIQPAGGGPVEQAGAECPTCDSPEQTWVAAIGSSQMGEGDEALGKILMKGFLYALARLDKLPDAVLFYNSGAYLTCEGSDSLEDIKSMEEAGTAVRTCGTCLNHYCLEEKLAAGTVTNMYDIVETLALAGKVVKP